MYTDPYRSGRELYEAAYDDPYAPSQRDGYQDDRIVYPSRQSRELREGYPRGYDYMERRDPFGYDDPYLPRGGGHREDRVAYQAGLDLEDPGNRGYHPKREPEQDGIGKIKVRVPAFDGKVDPYA